MLERIDFSAVIFDMDGLVLNTECTYRWAWKEAAGKMGYLVADSFFLELSGLPASEVLSAIQAYCGDGFDPVEFSRLSGRIWRRHAALHGIESMPGFVPLLDYLVQANMPFCLATNSTEANVRECLGLAGLSGVFSVVISREQAVQAKPAPDIFWAASERLGVPIGRCLVLEDSIVGIEAAGRAGAIPVLIATKRPGDGSIMGRCRLQLNDLEELLTLIRNDRTASN
ncbi:MAG: HAD family hydrolase [Gammaproteobacteria bacterium]